MLRKKNKGSKVTLLFLRSYFGYKDWWELYLLKCLVGSRFLSIIYMFFTSIYNNKSVILSIQKNKSRVLILGLNNAGKTTMLYKKKLGVVVQPLPTLGFNYEKIEIGNSELQSVFIFAILFAHFFMSL